MKSGQSSNQEPEETASSSVKILHEEPSQFLKLKPTSSSSQKPEKAGDALTDVPQQTAAQIDQSTSKLSDEQSVSAAPHGERDSAEETNPEAEHRDLAEQDRSYVPPRSIGRHLLWKRRRETWVPIITAIVSIVGLLLILTQVVIYDQQRKIMNDQVIVSDRNHRISERAYVSVASIKADLGRGEIVIMLENLGRVPATTIQVTADAYVVSTKLDGYKNRLHSGDVKLFPGSFQMPVFIQTRTYTPEEINAINDKKQFLYLGGVIQYNDGFGVSDSTAFGFEYNPPPNEHWTPVSTPVASLKETLESKALSLSLGPVSIMTPSPENSPRRIDKPSPVPSATVSPKPLFGHSFKIKSNTTGCACACSVVCENKCSYECSGCGLIEGTAAASRCCEEATKATPYPDPCIEGDSYSELTTLRWRKGQAAPTRPLDTSGLILCALHSRLFATRNARPVLYLLSHK